MKVTLLVPKRLKRLKVNQWKYFNVKKNFDIIFLPTLDFYGTPFLRRGAFIGSYIVFSFSCLFYLIRNARKDDLIYSNETIPLLFASCVFSDTFYEVHNFPERNRLMYKILFKRLKWVLATNRWKKEKLQKVFDLPLSKIIHEPNAVEIGDFNINITKSEARKQLGLSQTAKIAVYTGHLYSWKGVDTLAESAKEIPEVLIFFIGGTDKDIKNFRDTYGNIKNIHIVGHKPHDEIPVWQKAADVLVLPNTAKEDISKYYTSPMKLFEYMASGTPIVASNIPSVAEILNTENSVLSDADNSKMLAEKINWVLSNTQQSNILSAKALGDVKKYSWEDRAKRIMQFIEN